MRTALSRILLVALLGVAVVAVVTMTAESTQAVVAIDDVGADDLDHEAFEVTAAGRFAVEAAGSFEEAGTAASDTTLAAYGWWAWLHGGEDHGRLEVSLLGWRTRLLLLAGGGLPVYVRQVSLCCTTGSGAAGGDASPAPADGAGASMVAMASTETPDQIRQP